MSGKDSAEFTFIWRIENFSYCWHKIGERLRSRIITADALAGTTWSLCMYPTGENVMMPRGKDDCDYVDCELIRCDGNPENVDISVKLSIVAIDGSLVATQRADDRNLKKNHAVPFMQFVRRKELLKERSTLYLPDNTLTVCCQMWKKGVAIREEKPLIHCLVQSHFQLRKTSVEYMVNNIANLRQGVRKFFPVFPSWEKYPPIRLEFSLEESSNDDSPVKIEFLISGHRPNNNFCTCKLEMLNAGRKPIASVEGEHMFYNYNRNEVWTLPSFVTKSEILDVKRPFSAGSDIILRCEFVMCLSTEIDEVEYMSTPCSLEDVI